MEKDALRADSELEDDDVPDLWCNAVAKFCENRNMLYLSEVTASTPETFRIITLLSNTH